MYGPPRSRRRGVRRRRLDLNGRMYSGGRLRRGHCAVDSRCFKFFYTYLAVCTIGSSPARRPIVGTIVRRTGRYIPIIREGDLVPTRRSDSAQNAPPSLFMSRNIPEFHSDKINSFGGTEKPHLIIAQPSLGDTCIPETRPDCRIRDRARDMQWRRGSQRWRARRGALVSLSRCLNRCRGETG